MAIDAVLNAYWANLDKLREPFDKKNYKDVLAALKKQQQPLLSAIENASSEEEIIRICEKWKPNDTMGKEIINIYTQTGGYFAEKQAEVLNSIGAKTAQIAFETKKKTSTLIGEFEDFESAETDYYEYMHDWAVQNTGDKITLIDETTYKKINRAARTSVMQGAKEGLSVQQIAKLIREKTGITNRYRAMRIARTETASAQSNASQQVADQSRIELVKVWLSAPMTKGHRVEHQRANIGNYIVGKDETFNIGGESMLHPHDMSASAENVVNCRCGHAFYPKSRINDII